MKKINVILGMLLIFFTNISIDKVEANSSILQESISTFSDIKNVREIGIVEWINSDYYEPSLLGYSRGSVVLDDGIVIISSNGYITLTKVDFNGKVLWKKLLLKDEYNTSLNSNVNRDNMVYETNCMYSFGDKFVIFYEDKFTFYDSNGDEINSYEIALPEISVGDKGILFNTDYRSLGFVDSEGNLVFEGLMVKNYYLSAYEYNVSDKYIYNKYCGTWYNFIDFNGKLLNSGNVVLNGIRCVDYSSDYIIALTDREIKNDEEVEESDEYIEPIYNYFLEVESINSGDSLSMLNIQDIIEENFASEEGNSTNGLYDGIEYRAKLYSYGNYVYLFINNYSSGMARIYQFEVGGKEDGFSITLVNRAELDREIMIEESFPYEINNGKMLVCGSRVYDLSSGLNSYYDLRDNLGNRIGQLYGITYNLNNNKLLVYDYYNGYYIYEISNNAVSNSKLLNNFFGESKYNYKYEYWYKSYGITYHQVSYSPYELIKIYEKNPYIFIDFTTNNNKVVSGYEDIYLKLYDYGQKSDEEVTDSEKERLAIEKSEKLNVSDFIDNIDDFEDGDYVTAIARGRDGYYACTYMGKVLKYDFSFNLIGHNSELNENIGFGYADIDVSSFTSIGYNEDGSATIYEDVYCITKDAIAVKYVFALENVKSEVNVKYKDIDSDEEIYDSIKIRGYVGNEYIAENKIDEINNLNNDIYEFVKVDGDETGTIELNSKEITYWYRKKDSKVKVFHVEEGTDITNPENIINVLYDTEEIVGKIVDEYSTQDRQMDININSKIQYELISIPENANGTFGNDTQYIIYVYRKIPARIIVKHVDIDTSEELIESEEKNDYIGNEYITNNKLLEINEKYNNKYRLFKEPENKKGVYTLDEQEIIYYYQKKPANVIVKYIDIDTEEELYEQVNISGKIDDEYKTEDKIGEINNNTTYKYILEKITENTEGTMEENVTEVIYYYKKVEAQVIVKYLDEDNNEELSPSDYIGGKVGEEYYTEPKEISGYRLSEDKTPLNKTGKYTEDVIEVIYYYNKIPEQVNTGDIAVKFLVVLAIICIIGIVYVIIKNTKSKKK